MGAHRHVILFQSQFADLVESGAKLQTVRPWRKRAIDVGDVLDLRAWTGKPYRSKQRRLRESVVTEKTLVLVSIFITAHHTEQALKIGNSCAALAGPRLDAFAVADGFKNSAEFFDFFMRMYAKPSRHGTSLNFHGQLIGWSPLPIK